MIDYSGTGFQSRALFNATFDSGERINSDKILVKDREDKFENQYFIVRKSDYFTSNSHFLMHFPVEKAEG